MAASTTLMTSQQFLALPERYDANGNRIKEELVRGEVVAMPTPSKWHDIVKNQICLILAMFLKLHQELGFRALVEIAYATSDGDAFVPDVSVVRANRLLRSGERIIPGAPEIAVEVVSPTDTFIHIKVKIKTYLAHGSHSVWIAYPEEKLIEIHTAAGVREFKGGEPISDDLLPDFSQPVSAFFEGL